MSSTTPSTSSSPPRPIKKENEEEIKEFAETAMNELLGWYGYDRLELRRWAASRAKDASSPEQANEHKDKEECSWCNKSITSEGGALQQAGATFCSEVCFSQSRRANFKRAKTCDWCRHVRHTVAYVDFQDGATQLQFCSDKCLNQYKMHIFCRETQAHLDLNPHLVSAASSSSLITPELWLKNCRSRSASPISERSTSPHPENMSMRSSEKTETAKNRKSPLPLITMAPTAKLMKPKRSSEERILLQKSPEAKKDLRNKVNLRKRRTSKCSATVTSQTRQNSSTPKAQDLRMCSPTHIDEPSPSSTIGNNPLQSPTHPMNPHQMPPPFPNPLFGMPAPPFMDNFPHRHLNDQRHPMFQHHPNFMLPRSGISLAQERPQYPLPLNVPQSFGQAPPVTVLVPYPVVLPVPLPIPIPIPMSAFLQASLANARKVKTETRNEDNDGPLDFTMNSDKKREETQSEKNSSKPQDNEHSKEQFGVIDRIDEDDKTKECNETGNPEQTLPKFKITRLGNKLSKIVTKSKDQSESTRPLRKRRRIVEVATDDDPLMTKTRKIVQV